MTNNIHFNSIRIRGYRGRNFDLVMNSHGKHSVFVLDGNTGKTTTIELLRWCFIFKQTDADGKFRHMWNNPAHVLDHDIVGPQACSIAIEFSDKDHTYVFTRVTKGEYDNNTDDEGNVIGDKIASIEDTLEIDRGGNAITGDRANIFLNAQFRFDQCSEYFCFDGEKAKDVLILASDRKNLDFIQTMINKRATHPTLNKYLQNLDRLQQKVYDKAKSKVTDQGKTRKMNDLSELIKQREELIKQNQDFDIDYKTTDRLITQYEFERGEIRKQLLEVATDNQRKRDEYASQYADDIKIISDRRNELYKCSLNWLSHVDDDYINTLKYYVRESGKLPDPYYDDLIQECLHINKCKICGRELDQKSIEWIKKLEKLTASHDVQNFLLSTLFVEDQIIDPRNIHDEICQKSDHIGTLVSAGDSLQMSDLEKKLREQEKKFDYRIKQNEGKVQGILLNIQNNKDRIEKLSYEISQIETQIYQINEYRSIIENIKKTRQVIEETQNILKEKTTKIISDVLSESVSSILGSKFSAQFSKERGLLLGENGRYSPEIGGMSGRLILSYTFAETMTLIDPIIIDTPSGNVGTHREALAKHLAANHKQVICLCLPTELDKFAPYLVNENDILTVVNEAGGV
jgi:hypothetical protein